MKKGFTLIELLIVTVIVGILMAVAAPKFYMALERGRSAEGLTSIQQVADDLNSYFMAHGEYPSGDNLTPYSDNNGSYFQHYSRLKHYKRPSNWITRKDETRMQVQLYREGLFALSGFLQNGNLTGFTCSTLSGGDATKAARYCKSLGFQGKTSPYKMAITPEFFAEYNE